MILKKFLARALERIIEAGLDGDFALACDIADHLLAIAERVAARTPSKKDDIVVAQIREIHELVCGVRE